MDPGIAQRQIYRGRLAPSPTGFLHLGHARTFWTAQQRAGASGGTLVLRNEDLDRARSKPEFVSTMLEDMKWFGLKWHEGPDCGGSFGPYSQSERREFYVSVFEKLRLGRFSKNAVVNFDPDTAGAKATERTLGLLVEEEFNIKVLTLEAGFDPDLFIRRKGKEAYAAALRASQRYFDYLIERARTQFPIRSAEGKVQAVNYLLPHIQRVPSRIVRDELGHEMAQKMGGIRLEDLMAD